MTQADKIWLKSITKDRTKGIWCTEWWNRIQILKTISLEPAALILFFDFLCGWVNTLNYKIYDYDIFVKKKVFEKIQIGLWEEG